ncbi:MAG: hypothetical protein J2P44_13960 [Candidatus Dormibacteraeota bacterium]|nr:hypothetical protein [Candidatus Dormibacteraeota bacterium]
MLILASGIGEWVSAYVFFGLAFAVATIGVTGLGVWVLRGDARNRRRRLLELREQERPEETAPAE